MVKIEPDAGGVGTVLITQGNDTAAERISRRRQRVRRPARRWHSPVPGRAYAGLVTDLPNLQDTIIVAAFEGWNDAGDAASDALEHLDVIWEADTIVEIDDESYYDYQVNRPVIRQIDGVTRELVWPSMRISHCRPPGSNRDIVLMHGVEPNMRWRTFCAELLAIAEKLNVDTVVILGALLADTPHTRPVPVSGAAYSPESAKFFGLEETRYEGPTGIAGVFQDACVAAGIPAVTFWAAVPHYVSQPPNPKATVALLRRVEDVLDIEVPLADLPIQAEEWEQAVTEMTADDDEIAEYVQSLEERGDAEVDMTEALGKIDGDALAGKRSALRAWRSRYLPLASSNFIASASSFSTKAPSSSRARSPSAVKSVRSKIRHLRSTGSTTSSRCWRAS
jgi:predicted ATP-grasp superfamily ATP-dependent carboligase